VNEVDSTSGASRRLGSMYSSYARPMRLAVLAAIVAGAGATVTAVGAELVGRCSGSGYMNVAWGGMSKERCLQRAYEVNQGSGPMGMCGHVSYSASPGPQEQTNFCQCHRSCEELDHLPPTPWAGEQVNAEQWVTYVTANVPSADAQGSRDRADVGLEKYSKDLTISLAVLVVAVIVSVLTTCFVMTYCRKCRAKFVGSVQSDVARLEQAELGQGSARPDVVEGVVVAIIPSDPGSAAPAGKV